jgi:hypothetical protein
LDATGGVGLTASAVFVGASAEVGDFFACDLDEATFGVEAELESVAVFPLVSVVGDLCDFIFPCATELFTARRLVSGGGLSGVFSGGMTTKSIGAFSFCSFAAG